MRELLEIPAFSRLHDWLGPWIMLPSAYEGLKATILRTDWARHMADYQQKQELAAGRGEEDTLTQMIPVKGGKNIAAITLAGTLMKSASSFGGTSTVQARKEINAAKRDPNVHGILLAIDSPGGTVAGTAELGDAIKDATRSKPVYSYVDGLAASAAYWAASQTDMIFAGNRMTQTGSIGTYLPAYDFSKALEAEGVKAKLFTTGKLKGLGTYGMPITDEQSAHLQERVNEMQTHFDAAVRSGRGMNASQLEAVKSGAVFSAKEAMEKRLIDGIRTLDQTLAALAAAS